MARYNIRYITRPTKFSRFLISNFLRVLNIVCFLLGNSPSSDFYKPTFRNILFHLHRRIGLKKNSHTYRPMKMEQTECSEALAYKIQTPGELLTRKHTNLVDVSGLNTCKRIKGPFADICSFEEWSLCDCSIPVSSP